jgi:hypothetical protein
MLDPAKSRASSKSDSKPFIVDITASLLKRNVALTKGARGLYATMRALADGHTGELSINGHPLDQAYICREAEIGRYSWLKYIPELRDAGLVWVHRERVLVVKGGRRREVFGRAHYFVRRQADAGKTVEKPSILLKSDSRTVRESDSQISQLHLETSPRGVGVGSGSEFLLEPEKPQSSSPSPTPKTDDDFVRVFLSNSEPEIPPDNLAMLRAKAEKKLQDRSAPELLEIILDFVLQRLVDRAVPISSSNYIVRCVENLFQNPAEYNPLFDEWQNRARRRGDFMPDFDATKYSDAPDEELTKRVRDAIAAKGDA